MIAPIRQVSEAASPVLTEVERYKILVEWNQTERNYPRDRCVHQLFEEQVERTPEAMAVAFEGRGLTYLELNRNSNQLAHHLRSLGVGPDALVGLCVERSIEMVAALLGILKAGGAYLPLAPSIPEERLAFCIQDSQAQIIVTQRSLLYRFAGRESLRLVVMEDFAGAAPDNNPAPLNRPSDLAYVMYTSGSTGSPKGVAIEHRSVTSFLHWVRESFGDEELSGVLAATSISFDLSVFEIFGALSWGGQIILVQDVLECGASPDWAKVRLINTVPSLMEALLKAGTVPPAAVTVNLAGEALPTALVDAICAAWPVRRVNDLYGPTETTTYSTWTTRERGAPATIGRPISNTQVYVLDESLQPVPVGVAGELIIGGAGLARGYLHRPDLTAEKFLRDPFSTDPQARMYRTGDRAQWRTDGTIEYLGRLDHQVKIRGHRIELGEIESVLGSHPALEACVVVAQQNDTGEKLLAAFVVAREAAELSVGALRAWLGEKLPDYMIPSRFAAVLALPLNPNGKVDRKALAKWQGVELASGHDYVAPCTATERTLAEIWQEVLSCPRVGVQENFFDLGGHSLRAVQVVSRIRKCFQTELPVRVIFESPTIAELAAVVDRTETTPDMLPLPPSLPRQTEARDKAALLATPTLAARNFPLLETQAPGATVFPASFSQEQLWSIEELEPVHEIYNLAIAVWLRGPLKASVLAASLNGLIRRHESLRTTFEMRDGVLLQVVVAQLAIPMPEANLEPLPEMEREAEARRLMVAEGLEPFDLRRGPLLRARLFRLDEQSHILLLAIHHIVSDGWSMDVLLRELAEGYAAAGHGGPPSTALPLQFRDYAVGQRQHLTPSVLDQHLQYWRPQLAGVPTVLNLPLDRLRPPLAARRGAHEVFHVAPELTAALRQLGREQGATLFMTLLAAFQTLLHRHSGQEVILVGSPLAGRARSELEGLIGFFVNTLPLKADFSANPTFREVLVQMREALWGAQEHQELPFGKLVEALAPERAPGRNPFFQAIFVLQTALQESCRAGELVFEAREVPLPRAMFDLGLSVTEQNGGLCGVLTYDTALFETATAARWVQHYHNLLQSVAANASQRVSALPLMSDEERHRVLVEWNDTQRDYPRDQCVHQLFEEQVERAPDAVAVVFEQQTLTYGDLNEQANRLACHLRSLGVGPGELVALRVERSLEMIIGVLGILKAGGAYWALEEKLPEERFRLMLADAKPRVLLVRRKSVGPVTALMKQASADASVGVGTVAAIEDMLESPPAGTVSAAPPSQAGDPAYVNYTSGSTGVPKGVLVPHRGVVRLVKGVEYASLGPEETFLHLSPLSFDASTFELWGALLNGGRVVLLLPGPPALADIGKAIRQHGVTTLWLTAGLFHLMVDECLEDLKPLRQLLAGGDVLSPEHVRKARRALPGCRIVNGYGPTENTTFTCCYTVADEQELTPSVPIGRPIANTQVYVLDPFLQPVPVDMAGELYAGGDGLACGYLHRAELTAERFIPDPFSARAGDRLYRTGDCVRWRSDGNLEFLGRLDSQVKIRGFRIELGEIEAVLGAQPEVREATVIVRTDLPGDKRLVAYLVAQNKEQPDASALRARLAGQLPEYMLPNAFVWLDQLPLTPNGKVNRKALPAPPTSSGGTASDDSQPATLLELELVRIWQRLFRRQDISRRDNFFALGGHSLLAARLVAEVEKLAGCRLNIATLFQAPTVELLARRLTAEDWAPQWSSLVPLQPLGDKPPIFFVHGLGGHVYGFLGLAQRLAPDQPAYGLQALGLNEEALRHSTTEEMAAHYVREIRSFQPEGPYYLAGYSMGGVFAYEMAQQLHRSGQRVALLGLLDTHPSCCRMPWGLYFRGLFPHFAERWRHHWRDRTLLSTSRNLLSYFAQRARYHWRVWRDMPSRDRFAYLRGRWVAFKYILLSRKAPKAPVATTPTGDSVPTPAPGHGESIDAAGAAYRLRPYPGAVDVFVSEDALLSFLSSWEHLARGGARWHRVQGEHSRILDAGHVDGFAQTFKAALQRAQRETPSAGHTGNSDASLVS